MNPESILAMAFAMAASNPPLMRELEHAFEPAKPQTQADLDRVAAARVKRERKNRKRKKQQLKEKIDQLAAGCPQMESRFWDGQVVYQRPPTARMISP